MEKAGAEKKQHQESLLRNKFCKVLEGKSGGGGAKGRGGEVEKEKQYSTFQEALASGEKGGSIASFFSSPKHCRRHC